MPGLLSERPMKIVVNRVPFEGLREETQYDPATLDLARADIRVDKPLQVAAFIRKAEDELVVEARIRGRLHITCARCLEGFPQAVTVDALFSYPVKPTDVVDITEDVRQELLLTYPMAPTCRPDCKGLCPRCGQNLNVQACGHNP